MTIQAIPPLWIATAAIALALFHFSSFLKSYMKCVWLVLHLPGPFAWPVIGNAHWAVDSSTLIRAAVECPKKYGLIIRAWLSFYPIVFVFDPTHIQKILANPKHIEKTSLYVMMHNFLGLGLITCEGSKWRLHRKLMQPHFSLSNLEAFVGVFSKGGNMLVQNLIEKSDEPVNVTTLVNEIVFSVLTEAILGVPMGSSLAATYRRDSPYRQGSSAILKRLQRPWLLLPAVFNVTDAAHKENQQKQNLFDFTKKAIEQRKLLAVQQGFPEKCFLDYLLSIAAENPAMFNEDDCAHEACTLMLAGQDSVGAALAFMLHLLANHTEQQEKVFSEQNSIFEGSDRPLELEDLRKMTYLEQCIKEALRLYPSVPLFARKLGEDVPLGKRTLPKGCHVFISPFVTHRLSEIYPNPEKFNPDRFHPNLHEKRSFYSFLPFSLGPRNCIGYKFAEMEMKTILSTVLRNFILSPVIGKEKPNLAYRITLRASGGLWVNLTRRSPP